jgi:hypothetical protein
MDTGSIATEAGDLFEIVYFHQAGRQPTTFYVAIEEGTLQVNTETALARNEQNIPLSAVESLVWGRENLLYVNWRDGDQFRQTNVMANPNDLVRLVEELRVGPSAPRVDESSRHISEGSLIKTALIALLVAIGIPMAAFYIAVYLGYVANPWTN